MAFNEMNDNQRRVFIDTCQIFDAYMDAYENNKAYHGGMYWKKSKEKDYLFKSSDRYGYGKSLGVRSPETEKIFDEFHKNKQISSGRLKAIKERLKEQARFCKAAMIQRVPRVVTRILQEFNFRKMLGKNVIVIGTNALYAYEAGAGLFYNRDLMATMDMDILWDNRTRLVLASDQKDQSGLISILQKADRSFEVVKKQKFRAVNKNGYMVDLVKASPKYIFENDNLQMGGKSDLKAAEIMNLKWLLSSPKISQVVIGDDGLPALMVVPDPRAFALYKLWLSEQEDREPIKKRRDLNQSLTVAQTVIDYLPQYKFDSSTLRMFPKKIVQNADFMKIS
ncbi:MAG: nucleotidyltransferase domain-containing protein [Desulfobacterales bacterium]|nr:nucleotidyltransferase domain-containing protein [Desulfobacterales bacterium]